MSGAVPRLGIAEMDDDHARIDALLGSAVGKSPAELPALLSAVQSELAAHFAREEALLRDRAFPGLHRHVAQRRMILADIARAGEASIKAPPRTFRVVIPRLVCSHIATMDGMAASFLEGELKEADFEGLRLPMPEQAS